MTPRMAALMGAAIFSVSGCGEQAVTTPEEIAQPQGPAVAVMDETSDNETVSELEIACYDQRVAQLADIEIKSLLTSEAQTDSLSTDQTVRLARFYQKVAQECFG